MRYPVDFVAKVKAELPECDILHQALATGYDDIVSQLLDEARRFRMKPEKIIKAFEEGRQQEVLDSAKKAVRREKLFIEWCLLNKVS